jgi:hypothetical protein
LGIDTFLVLPVGNPTSAARLLADGGDEVTRVGDDYVVLYKGDRFTEVEQSPEVWGPRYVQELPPSLRRGLDARGLLAIPEVGQSFESKTYAEVVEVAGPALWLPLRRARRSRRKRLFLVALSPERERMLLESPELVRELIASRAPEAIPGSLEFDEIWIELQRLIFDCSWLDQRDDERADALAPRSGLSFLEDESIDAARLVRADRARSTAEWLSTLTPEIVDRARKAPPSPASLRFPESLGATQADDHEPLRKNDRRKRAKAASPELERELSRLSAFYEDVRRTGRSVLSVRFRE